MEGNMSRPKGTRNKPKPLMISGISYSLEERIDMLANLIVDRIIEDRKNGQRLLTIAGVVNDA
jgi:hypothetical protein